jgi:hypothetical protein
MPHPKEDDDQPFSMEQEPEVMPGFEAPGNPWPSLSRDQVRKLQEGLRSFREVAECPSEDRPSRDYFLVEDLLRVLRELDIGDSLVTSPLGEKRNCWTCRHNDEQHDSCRVEGRDGVAEWISECPGEWVNCMPPKDADGCPGWEPASQT